MQRWQKVLRLVLVMVMAKWNRNGEGYVDSTASVAIQKVLREERKSVMTKKRRCRRTTDENIIHEKAVKMRKMTDEQLVHYVEDMVEKARSEGFNQGRERMTAQPAININNVIEEIGKVKGIGTTKLENIETILKKHFEEGGGSLI